MAQCFSVIARSERDEAIHFAKHDGLLRFARNDEQTAMMNCLASAVPALYRFRFEPEFPTS